MKQQMNYAMRRTLIGGLVVSTLGLSGCFPLALTGAAVGTMVALDRRTLGAQTEDQAIELKASSEIRDSIGSSSGISVTSFNRKVLLTGQVRSDQVKRQAERLVAGVPNVRSVHNELQVSGQPSLSTTASDMSITTRVKAALVRSADVQANTVKVVTEAGTVYLMGLVSQREAARAAQVASEVRGVLRVITVFEIISEAEAHRLSTNPPAQ